VKRARIPPKSYWKPVDEEEVRLRVGLRVGLRVRVRVRVRQACDYGLIH